MRNITVTVSDEIYLQARVWAAERDTSVSAVVQYLLQTLPKIQRAVRAYPARNPRHTSDIPVPAADPPSPDYFFAVFDGETVEPILTRSI